jgi:3-deoxy-7-phosphoheptulonate synthase
MGFDYIEKIPEPEAIIEELPLAFELKKIKLARDEEISAVFRGESDKFILIIGPCSAHDEEAVCEYVGRLAGVQEQVKDKLILVPRIYTNKPRTTGIGYKGMAHQPDPKEAPNIVEGIRAIRRMHIRALRESHLTRLPTRCSIRSTIPILRTY